MTYVVGEKCIKCKYTDCVAVCPVDCFYEGENMLVINPDECIDCGVCVAECPIRAIDAEDDADPKWIEKNEIFAKKWPNLNKLLEPLDGADEAAKEQSKEKYFSEKAGSGKPVRK